MIKRVIALFSAICIASAVSGCSSAEAPISQTSETPTNRTDEITSSQTDETSASQTEEEPLVIEGNEYECGDFKFTISGKYNEDFVSSDKTDYEFSRGEYLDATDIDITSGTVYYADLKTYIDDIAENGIVRYNGADIEATATDTELECRYSAGAVHFEMSNDKGISRYFIENETRSLEIQAIYKLSRKTDVIRDMDALVASAEYISDYTFPTEDTEIDDEYLSVTLPKEWYYRCVDGSKNLYESVFGKARAQTREEGYTNIILRIYEKREKSPEELADGIAELHTDSDEKVSRFKYEIFGIESECTEAVYPNETIRACYFEHDGLLWSVLIDYWADDELADIEDMLSRIELK